MFTCSRSCYPSLLMGNRRNVVDEISLGRSWNGVLYVLLAAPDLTYIVSLTAISSNLIRTRINLPVTSQTPREVFLSLQNTDTVTVHTIAPKPDGSGSGSYCCPLIMIILFCFVSFCFSLIEKRLSNDAFTPNLDIVLAILSPSKSMWFWWFINLYDLYYMMPPYPAYNIGRRVEPVNLKGLRLSNSTF